MKSLWEILTEKIKVEKLESDKLRKRVLYALSMHVEDDISLSREAASLVKDALSRGECSDLIKVPSSNVVLRGMNVNEDYLRRALRLGKRDELPESGERGSNFSFVPWEGRAGSSWTSDETVVQKYSRAKFEPICLVLKALTGGRNSGNFVELTNFAYEELGSVYDWERETIGLGRIKLESVSWTKNTRRRFTPKV